MDGIYNLEVALQKLKLINVRLVYSDAHFSEKISGDSVKRFPVDPSMTIVVTEFNSGEWCGRIECLRKFSFVYKISLPNGCLLVTAFKF